MDQTQDDGIQVWSNSSRCGELRLTIRAHRDSSRNIDDQEEDDPRSGSHLGKLYR